MTLFALISVLIGLAALASFISHRYIKLPTTIGVMLVSLGGSVAVIFVGHFAHGFHRQVAAIVDQIDFNQVVLHCMLAFLLFAGSIHVNLADLGREWLTIALLAIVGTIMSTFLVGGLTFVLLWCIGSQIPWMHALLFGALISPTDPIAVLGVMKSIGAPRQLEVQLAGESLFNDGFGVVVFVVLLELTGGSTEQAGSIGAGTIGLMLLKEVGGAILLGMGMGTIVYQMIKRVDNYQVEVLLTLALAMGVYALGDAIHLSAPIAVVVAGVLIGNHGRSFAMSEKSRAHVDTFWELIDDILNVLLFLLIGLQLLVLPLQRRWLLAGLLAIVIVLLARWVSVFGILWPLRRVTSQSRGAITILTWGGLRGGLSIAMALSLPPQDSRSLLLMLTYCVVVFSILFQGLTVGRVIRKLTAPTPADVVATN